MCNDILNFPNIQGYAYATPFEPSGCYCTPSQVMGMNVGDMITTQQQVAGCVACSNSEANQCGTGDFFPIYDLAGKVLKIF